MEDGIGIDRGNRSTWRKLVPQTFCTPQIPHDLSLTGGVFMRKQCVFYKAGNEFSDIIYINLRFQRANKYSRLLFQLSFSCSKENGGNYEENVSLYIFWDKRRGSQLL
jgi:hypothetical protein